MYFLELERAPHDRLVSIQYANYYGPANVAYEKYGSCLRMDIWK